MNKKILSSIIAITMCTPAMADIGQNASTATCDSATIGATSGDANLQAAWQANTINLDWYNGDTKQTSTTCQYDGAITLPSNPSSRTGYTFGGWRVRTAAAPSGPNCKAISTYSECVNTSGCMYSYNYTDGVHPDGCLNLIPLDTTSYSKCSDITNKDTCESIGTLGYNNTYEQVCDWHDTYGCHSTSLCYGCAVRVPSVAWCEYAGTDGYYYANGACGHDD